MSKLLSPEDLEAGIVEHCNHPDDLPGTLGDFVKSLIRSLRYAWEERDLWHKSYSQGIRAWDGERSDIFHACEGTLYKESDWFLPNDVADLRKDRDFWKQRFEEASKQGIKVASEWISVGRVDGALDERQRIKSYAENEMKDCLCKTEEQPCQVCLAWARVVGFLEAND